MKVLDLFSGAGGMSKGFEDAGFGIVAGIDNDENAIKTFEKNHKNSKGYVHDIADKKFIDEIIKNHPEIDVIIGGPPCQGFSLKGKKLGLDDKRNYLFQAYLEYVKKIKPKYFVIENVQNIIHSEKGYFKDQIIELFENEGYKIN
jgi:DNA-cytosine methyltransferase